MNITPELYAQLILFVLFALHVHLRSSDSTSNGSPNTMRPISRAVLRPYVCPTCRHGSTAGRRRFGSKSDSPELFDVVCVGGGPAGLGLLAALRMYNTMQISRAYTDTMLLQELRLSPQSSKSPSLRAKISAKPNPGTSNRTSSPTELAA